MNWHFNMFGIDNGRQPTPFQRFIYRFVNYGIPNLFALIVLLGFLAMLGGWIYIVIHFVVKYW